MPPHSTSSWQHEIPGTQLLAFTLCVCGHAGKDSSGQKAPQVEALTVDPAAHEALLTSQAGMKLTLSSQVCHLLRGNTSVHLMMVWRKQACTHSSNADMSVHLCC